MVTSLWFHYEYVLSFISFRNFKKSNNAPPKLSYIPTCFYGKEAETYWNTEDYNEREVRSSRANNDQYRESLNLEEPDFYKYKQCKKFAPKPTDHAICHTFNGLELKKILKPSSWMDAYQDAFTGGEMGEVFRSEGVDKTRGLMFSVDTMQSFFITKKKRYLENIPINSFMIKLHQPGELPWIEKDKSTWQRIKSTQNEMVTHFLTIKGEKVINTVSILNIMSS